MSSQLVEAHRICEECGEAKPESGFERYRRRCIECRRRARRKPVCAFAFAPTPPAIPIAELREPARPDRVRPAPADLVPWLLDQELALEVPGGLTPTARCVELVAGIG